MLLLCLNQKENDIFKVLEGCAERSRAPFSNFTIRFNQLFYTKDPNLPTLNSLNKTKKQNEQFYKIKMPKFFLYKLNFPTLNVTMQLSLK